MNILITSAGRRSYLIKYFKEAIKGKGKVFASNCEYTIALQEADDYFISPMIYDDHYVESLIIYCKKNDITAIISVFDIDLLVLSKAKDIIEKNRIRLLLSGEDVIGICNDKWKTYQFLKQLHIGTPKTYKSLDAAKSALEAKELVFPVIIKPRWGLASLGLYTADNTEELEIFYKKSIKDINSSYLKYESAFTPGEMILFQEKLTGQEYGLDVINDLEGNFICVLPKSKLAMRAGETDLGKTVLPARFRDIAMQISNRLRHILILSVDCFEVKGRIYVIEMNGRISGHYPLSHLAGANLPKQIIEWLEGKPTNMDNFLFKEGICMIKDLSPTIINFP